MLSSWPSWLIAGCGFIVLHTCNAGGFWGPYTTFITVALMYGGVAGSLVSFVEPLAGGSGIPEVKTYLNGIHIKCATCLVLWPIRRSVHQAQTASA